MSIVEFLEQRLDEDEAVAQAATSSPWRIDPRSPNVILEPWPIDSVGLVGEPQYDLFTGQLSSRFGQAKLDTVHIARWEPARVLAEVTAKRAILNLHAPRVPYGHSQTLAEMLATGDAACSVCGDQGVDITTVYHPCDTLLVLARIWSDHPDFDPAWTA